MNKRDLIQIATITACGLITAGSVAFGATYQFYFNNTEQGDNSTATPQLHVQADKALEKTAKDLSSPPSNLAGPLPAPSPTAPAAPAIEIKTADVKPATEDPAANPSPVPSPVAVSATPAEPPKESEGVFGTVKKVAKSLDFWQDDERIEKREKERSKWRLMIGGSVLGQQGRTHYDTGATYESWSPTGAIGVTVRHDLKKRFGVAGFISSYAVSETKAMLPVFGVEADFVPMRLDFFGRDHLLELALIGGVSSFRRAEGNLATIHLGSRLNFSPSQDWGLALTGRGNLGYAQGELALVIHM